MKQFEMNLTLIFIWSWDERLKSEHLLNEMLYLFQMSQELSKILREHLNRGNLCKSRTQSFTQLLVAKATFLYSVRWNGWKFFYLKFQKILKFFQLFLISYRTNHFLSNQSLRGRCQNHVTQSTVTNHLISDIISK